MIRTKPFSSKKLSIIGFSFKLSPFNELLLLSKTPKHRSVRNLPVKMCSISNYSAPLAGINPFTLYINKTRSSRNPLLDMLNYFAFIFLNIYHIYSLLFLCIASLNSSISSLILLAANSPSLR